jgi:membrane-associated progesterone receptor component
MKRGALMTAATWLAALSLTAGLATLAACSQGDSDPGSPSTVSTSQTTSTSPTTPPSSTSTTSAGEPTFTLDDLAQFDGKDGRAAYVAVDGVVYDLTGSRSWPDGNHSRCSLGAVAGKDLSEEIKSAPSNMRALLAMAPIVGKMAE